MTKGELELLLVHEERFSWFLNGIAASYEKQMKPYTESLPRIDFQQPFNGMPAHLYKYISFGGGISSLDAGTLQFSHPLGFRENLKLGDKTEFWFDRLYVDGVALRQMKQIIVHQYPEYSYFQPKDVFLFLLHHHVLNIVERNKVLCLSKSFNNQALWNDFKDGICIEYDTEVFRNNGLMFPKPHKYTILGRHILYVDQIVKYPIRISDDDWLSNFIFVKNMRVFLQEDEYRMLYTTDFDPVKAIPIRYDRIKMSTERLLESKPQQYTAIRPTIDRKYISKVYYTDDVADERRLREVLEKHEIDSEKITI